VYSPVLVLKVLEAVCLGVLVVVAVVPFPCELPEDWGFDAVVLVVERACWPVAAVLPVLD